MEEHNNALAELLTRNSQITLAYIVPGHRGETLHLHMHPKGTSNALRIPQPLNGLAIALHVGPTFRDLRADADRPAPETAHTICQNEPVQLGCQIQPAAGNWVGTAGAPVRWKDPQRQDRWGILSNWHVMAADQPQRAGQYQPDRSNHNVLAQLADSTPPSTTVPNELDAAIADARVDGKHTIARRILSLGEVEPRPIAAHPDLQVAKSGRTTGLTRARCSAIGAAVRVSYGRFTALFTGQDVYQELDGRFSAAGDSGSLIVATITHQPVSLLFAGGGDLTIGNPIQKVIDHFALSFAL